MSEESDGGAAAAVDQQDSGDDTVSAAEVIEQLRKAIDELDGQLTASDERCKELQDKLLRALAENENSRVRYRKEVTSFRFSCRIKSFCWFALCVYWVVLLSLLSSVWVLVGLRND